MKYTITGYPTLEDDAVRDEMVRDVEGNSQQKHRPNTDQDKGAEVYQTPPRDKSAIMLNGSAVAFFWSMQFITVIIEHVDSPSSNVRREEILGRHFQITFHVGSDDES